jgi:hypothetical protein
MPGFGLYTKEFAYTRFKCTELKAMRDTGETDEDLNDFGNSDHKD